MPMVNHHADRPSALAIWAVPTVEAPPTHVPSMLPAINVAPAERPLRLNSSAESTLRPDQAPAANMTMTVRVRLAATLKLMNAIAARNYGPFRPY